MGQYRRRIVIKNRAFNLEKEALFASGIREKRQIAEYSEKLGSLYQEFTRETIPASHPLLKAKTLFSWLWEKKPTRYNPHGSFKLNHVIDAQLSKETQAVGNCLGLTLLYNCLLRRMSIRAEVIYLEDAFRRGPHVLTSLPIGDPPIDVENILPEGFDYKGHLNNPSRTRWGDKELVADIYLSVGNDFFEKKEWIEALKKYDLAIRLNPRYEKARLNKAILLDKIEGEERTKNGR